MAAVLHDNAADYEREYQGVRAVFVEAGTSLNKWLIENDIDRRLAYRALKGQSFGKHAIALRLRILSEARRIRGIA